MIDILEDAWDYIVDGFYYIVSFEWLGDFWDAVTEAFSNLNEFSYYGVFFGILSVGVSYFTKYVNLNGTGLGLIESMTQFMPPTQRIFWTIVSYIGAAIGGYILGSYFENS